MDFNEIIEKEFWRGNGSLAKKFVHHYISLILP